MTIIVLAIINSIIWTLLTIRWKSLRSKDIASVSAFGLVCAGLPLWLLTFGFLYLQNEFVFSEKYILNSTAWVVLCIITNIGGLFILKFKALSELGIYKLAISAFVAMFIDIAFFKYNLNTPILIGITLLLGAGFLLPVNKQKQGKEIKLQTTLLLLLLLSIAGAIQFAVYKNALMIQVLPLLHAMFAQSILYAVFLIISFKSLKKDYIEGKLKVNDFIFFGVLIYIFTIIEAFLFKALPITLLISLTVLNILLFQIYDIKNKELKHSWQLYLATCLAIVAIVLIKFK